MAPAAHIPDPAKRRGQAYAEVGRCLANIRRVINENYDAWAKLPLRPPLNPFKSLSRDLLVVQRNLEGNIRSREARQAFGTPLDDPQFPMLVEEAVLTLKSYIYFREDLRKAAPKQPTPGWLQDERDRLVRAINEVRKAIKPLKTALEP